MNKVLCLYQFVDSSNIPFYVGITNSFKRRRGEHLRAIKKGTFPVYKKIRKLQLSEDYKLNMVVIKENLTLEEANNLEIETIKKYKEEGIKLCNLSEGGGGRLGYHVVFSKEWKDKLKEAKKRQFENGYVNYFKGKHHSEKTKKLLSEKGVERYKDKPGTFTGKHHSKETKKLLSENAKKTFTGTTQSEEHKRKKSESYKKTVLNYTEKQKEARSKVSKMNGIKSRKKYLFEVENIFTGTKFSFKGTFVDLSKHILKEYNEKVNPQSLNNTIRKTSNSTKTGWKITSGELII